MTPRIKSITPDRGTAAGGTNIAIVLDGADAGATFNVKIDNIECSDPKYDDSSKTLSCTTGKRATFVPPRVDVF